MVPQMLIKRVDVVTGEASLFSITGGDQKRQSGIGLQAFGSLIANVGSIPL